MEAVAELSNHISQFSIFAGTADKWIWTASADGRYTTKSAYQIINQVTSESPTLGVDIKLLNSVWRAKTPQKTSATAWRLLLNRLPTCDNLLRMKILENEDEATCGECHSRGESANHVFLQCSKAEMVWNEIQQWMGFYMARPARIQDFFGMFSSFQNDKKIKSLLLLTWVCTIWILWKKRNEKRFEKKEWDANSVVLEIKIRLWSWNKVFRIVGKELDVQAWCAADLINSLL
ncbi:uncharacterized protein LOC131010998 [Salvia miltiorrhiza]|uniref:uncharacterized protein LOC131010998 n=1 Tax=Salvia miltiorrhiza TaxID=226208 RepID=UPI0025AD7B0E|nr:uncharacterized protein LOC131010998 [Salvia miltiorrhiza]